MKLGELLQRMKSDSINIYNHIIVIDSETHEEMAKYDSVNSVDKKLHSLPVVQMSYTDGTMYITVNRE